jgi:hypothetical protein
MTPQPYAYFYRLRRTRKHVDSFTMSTTVESGPTIDPSEHNSAHGMQSISNMTWKDKESMLILLLLYTLQGIIYFLSKILRSYPVSCE